jgi:predicted secreted acid phosphatase
MVLARVIPLLRSLNASDWSAIIATKERTLNFALRGFAMRGANSCFAIGLILCTSLATAHGEDADSHVAALEKLASSLWVSTSGEYAACARQTYNCATEKLELALRDKTWTASTEQFEHGNFHDLPPAVIVNLDETVWNNTPYEAQVAKT